MIRFRKYIEALIISYKNGFNCKMWWCVQLQGYIVFCKDCKEYVDNDGICSNPFCPEEIDDL